LGLSISSRTAMRAAVQSRRGCDIESPSLRRGCASEEPARRGSHTSACLCLGGPTEKYGCTIPSTKRAREQNTRKSWQHFEHFRTAMARTGRHEEEASNKAVVGANCPRVQRRIFRMRVIMTAENCSHLALLKWESMPVGFY
jgi:hypothetical protein